MGTSRIRESRIVRSLTIGAVFDVSLVEFEGQPAIAKSIRLPWSESGEADAMLQREAEFLEAVQRPSLPRVLFHQVPDPDSNCQRQLIESYMQGRTLDRALAESTRNDRASILLSLLDVVERLHAHPHPDNTVGAFHGDLSPDNVLWDPACGVSLVDFGSAGTTGLPPLQTYGTPPYAAPEVLRGDARVGQAADRYAVGVISLEALTGGLTVAGEAGLAFSSLPEAARLVGIAEHGVAEGPVGLDPNLLATIKAVVAFDPRDRPRSLEELRQMLISLAAR